MSDSSDRRRSARLQKTPSTSSGAGGDEDKSPSTPQKKQPSPANKATPDSKAAMMEVDPPVQQSPAEEAGALFLADMKANVALLEKAVAQLEKRYTLRVLRSTASLRKRWSDKLLAQAVQLDDLKLPKEVRDVLLAAIGNAVDSTSSMDVDQPAAATTSASSLEVQVYLRLLISIYLLDQKQLDKGLAFVGETVKLVQSANRRTMDALAAQVYFYFARYHEVLGRLQDVRPFLLAAQRTATLRHDEESQAALINLLLRNYLHFNLYDQADKLVAKSTFPANAGNNQLARFMYYTGRIKAVQLDYTTANRFLSQAVRKAPQSNVAAGFQQTALKFSVIVQLLMGEIPERSVFRQAVVAKALTPYFHITQAVRTGDLEKFQQTLAKYTAQFKTDKTYTLILRLRHNVIKTGVRMISLSYARISLKDICLKLHLDSEEDAEFIVAKAIRDGVIDATIDHEHGFMKSKDVVDIYATTEPQQAFHQRIHFCLNLHNESVKAMRFPRNAQKPDFELSKDLMELEREIAEMADEDMDDDGEAEF